MVPGEYIRIRYNIAVISPRRRSASRHQEVRSNRGWHVFSSLENPPPIRIYTAVFNTRFPEPTRVCPTNGISISIYPFLHSLPASPTHRRPLLAIADICSSSWPHLPTACRRCGLIKTEIEKVFLTLNT